MAKSLRPLFLLIAFLASTVVTLATVEPTPAQANTSAPALFKIVPMETTTTPVGCIGCPPMTSSIPAFEAQSRMGQDIAAATEIDTFSTSIYNSTTSQWDSIDGGCAVVAAGLKCWGSNTYGQLGNGLTTDSPNTTVTATDNGAPLSGVTDVSTNGLTTCVVTNGALKCAGLGNWPGLNMKRTSTSQTITDHANGSSSSSNSNTYKLEVFDAQEQLLSSVQNTTGLNESPFSTQWVALPGYGANIAKVQVGSNSNSTATPTICVLTTAQEALCAVVEAGIRTTTSSSSAEYKCAPSDSWSTSGCSSWETYSSKSIWIEVAVVSAATWSWSNAGATNVQDISLPADSWGASTLCLAGAKTICRTFASGEFGDIKTIENADNSEMVYVSSGFGSGLGLCVYASGTVSCGGSTYTNTGPTMTNKLTPVAAMTRPKSIFVGSTNMMQKIYFVLESGILSADSWIFSCNGCNNQQGSYVSPVTAFKVSTATEFNFAESVTGATDNIDYIPLRVLSGSRRSRSSVQVSVKTTAGAGLVGTSIRWTAPDAPGTLSSSASSTLTSGEGGLARTTLVSGPITFTLSGGSLGSGATLQAASITTVVPDSGAIEIVVLDAPAIVSRTISVTLPDGSPVPSATVNLVNNYLTYAYLNSGSSTSTWSSRPRDTTGLFGQVNCAHCFAAPPRYATGSNGSVTFPSFNLGIRSTTHDADVSYDDGELNQNVKKSFTAINDNVQMPFMAKIATTINDADPSTPTVELNTDASGGVDIETSLVDEDNIPISEFESTAEVVCDAMETGGLISSTARVDNLCLPGPVTGPPPGGVTSRGVSSMSVGASSTCTTSLRVKTNASGKSTFKLCPSVSTRYRIRGTGALATRSFCVVVRGVGCNGVASGLTPTAPAPAPAPKTAAIKKLAKVKTGKSISFAAVNKVAKVAVPKGAKVVISVVGSSKSVCTATGTSIRALKPGTCRLKVSVTPKATAKVKKPKTKSTTVLVTVTGTPTVGVKKTITLSSALKLSGSALTDVSAEVSKASQKICSISGDRIRGLKKGSCVLLVSGDDQKVKLPITVK